MSEKVDLEGNGCRAYTLNRNHFLRRPEILKALHVREGHTFGLDEAVFDSLLEDTMVVRDMVASPLAALILVHMQSTKPLFPKLLEEYKILLYQVRCGCQQSVAGAHSTQGNMDLRDGVTSNSAWLAQYARSVFLVRLSHVPRRISTIDWHGRSAFEKSKREVSMPLAGSVARAIVCSYLLQIWFEPTGELVGYSNQHLNLTRVVLTVNHFLSPALGWS